ncbi:hypothetical protein OP10G_1888 [Fimbriimonas ginsengisoli Gsoil 348]|uniref:Uncharacterized protein n=1 Tax=Fimbriimonas ginsengisoli Gsoil 348 TaxID=661478 RepID=A0A068NP84_FIMGI|nr:hypothetical protein OP10G_1888 [Fimbriimonas ginsengisoli Gsoil 348]
MVVDVVLPVDPDSQDFRVQVLDRRGKALPFLSSETDQGSVLPTRIWFTGRYEVVGHVELQTRPYVWKTFKGVVFDK